MLIKKLLCILFHPIKTINNNSFIDIIDGNTVGEYECKKCKQTFLANNKRSWFRVKV